MRRDAETLAPASPGKDLSDNYPLSDVSAMTAGLSQRASEEMGRIDPAVLSDDILPEWSEEWLLSTREWFRQVRLHALEALCGRLCREARFGEALEAGLAAIACEPLRESSHRAVVRAHTWPRGMRPRRCVSTGHTVGCYGMSWGYRRPRSSRS